MTKTLPFFLLSVFLALPAGAAEPSTAPVPSSELQSTLQGLLAGNFADREAAQHRLEMLTAAAYQDSSTSRQLLGRLFRQLDDPTRQAAGLSAPPQPDPALLGALAEANYALSKFAASLIKLPSQRRQDLLTWALSEAGSNLITQAYNPHTDRRVAASAALAATDAPEATWILAQMINDDDREVELAGMDGAWDKKPTPELLDALWNRAIYNQNNANQRQQKNLTVRGRQISFYDQDYNASYRTQDVDIACDLLATMKDPAIKARFSNLLTDLAAKFADGTDYRFQQTLQTYTDTKNFGRLITAYRPREVVPALMRIVNSPNRDTSQISTGGKIYRTSSRISAAAMILQIAGEDPAAFNLTQPSSISRWAIDGADAEENKFVDDMKKWWETHAKEYDTK